MSNIVITINDSQACLKKPELDDMREYRVHQIALMERQIETEEWGQKQMIDRQQRSLEAQQHAAGAQHQLLQIIARLMDRNK